MSIEVPIDQLFAELERWGAGFLTTVSDDGRARFVSLRPTVAEHAGHRTLHFATAGRTGCANAAARPNVSIAFPPHPGSAGYSMIVDGVASVDASDGAVHVRPVWAVLHRPAS